MWLPTLTPRLTAKPVEFRSCGHPIEPLAGNGIFRLKAKFKFQGEYAKELSGTGKLARLLLHPF
jgi:hypothetical protein